MATPRLPRQESLSAQLGARLTAGPRGVTWWPRLHGQVLCSWSLAGSPRLSFPHLPFPLFCRQCWLQNCAEGTGLGFLT